MTYEVVLTKDAENDLDNFIQYLLFEKHSKQAAANVLQDFENTKRSLEKIASSLKLCDNLRLRKLGYRRINFERHRYFMLYRIEGERIIVDNIFHELQDFEGTMNYIQEIGGKYVIWTDGSRMQMEVLSEDGKEILLMLLIGLLPLKSFMQVMEVYIIRSIVEREVFVGI